MQQSTAELTIQGLGEESTVSLERQFLLGSRLDADVVLDVPGAAPTHLVINPSRSGALLLVLDQLGKLPVVVGSERVTEPRRLRHGDVVAVGPVRLVYRGGLAERKPQGPAAFSPGRAEGGASASPLESQRWSWFTAQRPTAEDRLGRTLYRLAGLAASASSEAELLDGTLELALEGVDADQGVIAVRDEDGSPAPVALAGVDGEEALPFGPEAVAGALEQGLVTTASEGSPALYVPVGVSDAPPQGALCLRRQPGAAPFEQAEVQLLASVGRLLAVALERVRLVKQLRAGGLALGRLQRRFEAALGAINEGLVLVYADGQLEPLNHPGELLLTLLPEVSDPLSPWSPLGAFVGRARAGEALSREVLRARGQAVEVSINAVAGLDAVIVVLRDVTGQQQVEAEHRRAQDALREEILQVSSREQRLIGQTLHDGLCQQLVGISLLAQGLAVQSEGTPGAVIATEIVNLLTKAAEDTRRVAKGLCPVALETTGLGSALEELAGSFEKMYPDVEWVVHREDDEVLGPRDPIATHLYHVAQEALSNAVQHGQPTRVEVTLEGDGDWIRLTIDNDGRPFAEPNPGASLTESRSDPGELVPGGTLGGGAPRKPKQAGGMGLRTMRYRAQMLGAELSVAAGPEGGTRVRCELRREGA